MSITIEHQANNNDPVDILKSEIELSRNERRAVSRQLLAEIVANRCAMKLDRAWKVVDDFCDEHEAGIPGYLSQEISVHWPKVVAFLIAVVAIVIFWFGLHAGPLWPVYVVAGVLALGVATLMFVHNLDSFHKFRQERSEEIQRPDS